MLCVLNYFMQLVIFKCLKISLINQKQSDLFSVITSQPWDEM